MQIPIFRGGGCMKKVKLGEICEVQAGGTPSRNKKEFWVQGNIPWVKIKDINSKYISKVEEHITELGLQFSSAKLFSRGTILYTIFATIGEVAILDIDAATNQAIAGLHLKSEKVLKEYLYFFLLSIKNRVKNDSRGVAQNNINLTYLKNIEVPIVENSIQQEICNNLTKINQIITLRNQQLIELSNLVKSRFNEMFGDVILNDKEWKISKWNEILTIRNGKNQKNVEDKNGQFPIYGSGGIIGYAKDWIVKKNSVIIGRKGNINKPILVRENFWNVDTAFGLEPTLEKINSEYLFYFCQLYNFEKLNKAVTIPSLTKSDLLDISLPLPPLTLQNEFADFVAQVDKSQFACQIVIKLWRNSLKSSII